jgi:crotonobetainyl-CoA:carnitine CoA-transferase CaiB-like acyl-CoA transferase
MQPLEGFRVLDLTHVLAGPCATHHLRCMGAEVIKVERPGTGDPMRELAVRPEMDGLPPGFRSLNAGKKSVVLDLATAEGHAELLKLARNTDIFVENFRPGVAPRLGLGPADIRTAQPRIIYCSISGWGQSGRRSTHGAYDHVIQAATGMMRLQGTGGPMKVGFPVIDIATGMNAAEAILAAVIRRLRGDTSPITIDVSMVDSALALMSGHAAATLATGKSPERVGNRGFVGSPGAETFATSDGHISVAANTMKQFATLCRLLSRPDLAAPPYIPGGLAPGAFLNNLANDALRRELTAAFAATRADKLETILNDEGVPAARVRDLCEYLSELYIETPGIGVDGEKLAFGPAFRWDGGGPIALPPAPRLGADTDKLTSANTSAAGH